MANYKTQDLPDGENTDPPDSSIVMVTVDPGGTPVDQYATLTNIKKEVGARVYHDANQSIPDNSVTELAFNSEVFDNDGIHNNSVNNERLICQTDGVYIIGANVDWAPNANDRRVILIYLDGATLIGSVNMPTLGAVPSCRQSIVTVYPMVAGQYVSVSVYQNTGGALNITATTAFSPSFWMYRLGA